MEKEKDSVVSLVERLQKKKEQFRQQSEESTLTVQQQLEQSLKEQSAAALNSTKAAMQKQVKIALSELNAGTKQIEEQQQELEQQIKDRTKRLIWMLRLPVLVMLGVCLLICLGLWAYWRLASPYTVETMNNGQYQVMKGDWSMCNIGTAKQPINRPCRPN